MKKNYLITLSMSLTLILSCSIDKDETESILQSNEDIHNTRFLVIGEEDGSLEEPDIIPIDDVNNDNSGDGDDTDTTVADVSTDLMAGQHTDAGSVTVSDVDGTIDVTYQTDGDWVIIETHLYVGSQEEMPANNPGNPRIGQFPYATEHDSGTTSFTYSDLLTIPSGECVWVAAHAVVYNTVTGQEETAWAFGEDIDGNSWAMWFEVCNIPL